MEAVRRTLSEKCDSDLPINKEDYIKLVSLCVNFNSFVFEGEEFKQHRGLAMGSPLSAVMASLFMETLETDEYVRIIGRDAKWYRYVDDVLVIVPQNTDVDNKLRRLNEVNKDIQFTVENEENNELSFLDVLIHRKNEGVRFSVYRKLTTESKQDL